MIRVGHRDVLIDQELTEAALRSQIAREKPGAAPPPSPPPPPPKAPPRPAKARTAPAKPVVPPPPVPPGHLLLSPADVAVLSRLIESHPLTRRKKTT